MKTRPRKQHNALVMRYQSYKKYCVKNKVLAREFEDWLEYYNIEADENG